MAKRTSPAKKRTHDKEESLRVGLVTFIGAQIIPLHGSFGFPLVSIRNALFDLARDQQFWDNLEALHALHDKLSGSVEPMPPIKRRTSKAALKSMPAPEVAQ